MTVYLSDEHSKLDYNFQRLYFIDAAIWATKHCKSFKNFDMQDVSDHSLTMDQVAAYHFTDPKDAMWFELKWR